MNEAKTPTLMSFAGLDELSEAITKMALAKILQGISTRGIFHLALTGGGVGGVVTRELVSQWNDHPEQYAGLHLWWGDERFLPAGDEERNATVLLESLNENSPIHLHQILSSDSGLSLSVAGERYATDITGINMDLTLLGVGADGHVASIFPGRSAGEPNDDIFAVSNAPKNPPERISFSMAKINSSDVVWLMAAGASKRGVVAQILAHDLSIPATLVHGKLETRLFVDFESTVIE